MDDPLSGLRMTVDELTERLDRLTGHNNWVDMSRHADRLDELEERVGHYYLSNLEEGLDELRTRLVKVAREADESVSLTRQLDTRLRLLERRLRASGGTKTAELDQWPASFRPLLDAIRIGEAKREQLLSDYDRSRWKIRIAAPDTLRDNRQKHVREAIEAARTIATADPADDPTWAAAQQSWNAAVTSIKDLAPKIEEAVESAGLAQKESEAAQHQHNLAVGPVNEGVQARNALRVKVRTRLGEALRDDLLLPTWFERILGPTAPAENTESWLQTAVDVVIYRLVHRVDDSVLALGKKPTEYGFQQREYDELHQRSARWRA